ncbi:MAG: tetratricopeptide repeat protein [Pyrinomonadaceae bacterium]
MRLKNLTHTLAAALFIALMSAAAAAQVVTASGTVTLRQADGTDVPVKDAVIKFYRTDIKQEFSAKTDKSGRYVNAGIPLVGTFTIVVSAPGAQPDFLAGVRLGQRSENNFKLIPGDGSALTLEQTKAATTAAPAAARGEMSAEDKKKMAEELAKRAEIEAKNRNIEDRNAKLPPIFTAANTAINESNKLSGADKLRKLDEAITLYDQGIGIDADEAVLYLNKGIALRSRGVEKYNLAVRSKDKAERDAGFEASRADLKTAVDNGEKALALFRNASQGGTAAGAAPAAPGNKPNDELLHLSTLAETYRLAMQTKTSIDNEAAAKAIQAYIAVEPDSAKKDKAQASLGDALFFAGRVDEAVAKFREVLTANPNNLDAMYGLGLALASVDPPQIAEARDTLQQYVSKAPETNPRKQEATEMVKYLEDTLKSADAAKQEDAKKGSKTNTRRRP